MGKVMNIYGVMIDDNTLEGQRIKKWRSDKSLTTNSKLLEKWTRQLLINENVDFYLYIHQTKPENLYSIICQGLKIYEEGGALESTMSRAFDSTSRDIEGDINYFLNALNSDNYYGSCRVVAIIPKDYATTYKLIHQSETPTVPPMIIAFGVDEYGHIIPGVAYLQNGNMLDEQKMRLK